MYQQDLCFCCLEVGTHEDSCPRSSQSYDDQIDEIDREATNFAVNFEKKPSIATATSDKNQTDASSVTGNSPSDQEWQIDVEEMTQQPRGRPIKNRAQLLKDFNLYLARQLDIKTQGSISKKTLFTLVYSSDRNFVLSKLSKIASALWKPNFKGSRKQVEAKMKVYRHKCRELFHKFKKERWDPPK